MGVITCRSHFSWSSSRRLDGRSKEVQISYLGGGIGAWKVTRALTHCGPSIRAVTHVHIQDGLVERPPFSTAWVLNGVVSNSRYVAREEQGPFDSTETSFSQGEATCAALIPIRRSLEWWKLHQYDRTQIIEARSRSISRAMRFLPAIARRIQQGRGLSEEFDCVTWFEFSPQDNSIIDDMLDALRASEEWQFVDREIEIRLELA